MQRSLSSSESNEQSNWLASTGMCETRYLVVEGRVERETFSWNHASSDFIRRTRNCRSVANVGCRSSRVIPRGQRALNLGGIPGTQEDRSMSNLKSHSTQTASRCPMQTFQKLLHLGIQVGVHIERRHRNTQSTNKHRDMFRVHQRALKRVTNSREYVRTAKKGL